MQVLIFIFCKVMKTREKRKFKHVEPKPNSNGSVELQEIVSKEDKEFKSQIPSDSATAPPLDSEQPNNESNEKAPKEKKKRKVKKPLPGEDFYAGKDTLSPEHHDHEEHHKLNPYEESSDEDPLALLLTGGHHDHENKFI